VLARPLGSLVCALLVASLARAEEREDLAWRVQAVARAVRANELSSVSPAQLEELRKAFGPDAGAAVAGLKLLDVVTVETVDPPDDPLSDFLGTQPELARFGAMALSEAMHQAHATYANADRRLPPAVKLLLSISFPKEVLERVRVVDTDAEGSLPAIINEVQTRIGEAAAGGQSAVTIDDVIAFSEIPEPSAIDFWAHEVQHVVQFQKLGGIDAFAAQYTRDYRKLEADANAVAVKALADAHDVLTVIRALYPQ
jgi:hypothetical protein